MQNKSIVMKGNYVITIGRQLGSGGRDIGHKVAARLNLLFFDKELIRIAAKESGIKEDIFEEADEKKTYSLLGGLLDLRGFMTDDIYTNYYLSNETLFKIQSDVIRKLAAEKSCLIVGRCADYVLKDHPRCLRVFVCADMSDRIRRVSAVQNINEEKAEEFIQKMDRKRADYYSYFTGKTWGAATSYDLCVNSSSLGIDDTVKFIRVFAEKRFLTQD
jgi:cytidylate kinase